jgi:hypothetical protein
VTRAWAVAALIGCLIAAGGCGDDSQDSGGNAAGDVLVEIRDSGRLDFPPSDTGESHGSTRVDTGFRIDPSGNGEWWRAADARPHPFHATPAQLAELKQALDRVDLDELEDLYGAGERDPFTTEVTVDGRTVKLGDRLYGANQGEEPAADALDRVRSLLGEVLAATVTRAKKN